MESYCVCWMVVPDWSLVCHRLPFSTIYKLLGYTAVGGFMWWRNSQTEKKRGENKDGHKSDG